MSAHHFCRCCGGGCACPDGTPRMPCCCLHPSDPGYCGDNAELCECACACPDGSGILPAGCCNGEIPSGDPRCNCDTNFACCSSGVQSYYDLRFPRVANMNVSGAATSRECRRCECDPPLYEGRITNDIIFSGLLMTHQVILPASPAGGCSLSQSASSGSRPAGDGTRWTFPIQFGCSVSYNDCNATAQTAGLGSVAIGTNLGSAQSCTLSGSLSVGALGVAVVGTSATHSLPASNATGSCVGQASFSENTMPGGGCAGRQTTGNVLCSFTGSSICPGIAGQNAGDANISAAGTIFPVKFCPGAFLAPPSQRRPIIRPTRRFASRRAGYIVVPGSTTAGCSGCRDSNTGGLLI